MHGMDMARCRCRWMQVRITDVVCSGRCRVSLKPLLNELPIVGAVQVTIGLCRCQLCFV